jgi:hypothetical protein
MKTKAYSTHALSLQALISLIEQTETRAIAGDDPYFIDNSNFFCKSFLITTCTYLESYLKEVASVIIEEAEERLRRNIIAHNIVRWSLDKANNLKIPKYEPFKLNVTEGDIDDNISGNVHKTLTFFMKLGINLDSVADFVAKKDIIGPIVIKRNKIVHYNDDASDLSLGDIKYILNQILEYILIIDSCISAYISPCLTNPFIDEESVLPNT